MSEHSVNITLRELITIGRLIEGQVEDAGITITEHELGPSWRDRLWPRSFDDSDRYRTRRGFLVDWYGKDGILVGKYLIVCAGAHTDSLDVVVLDVVWKDEP